MGLGQDGTMEMSFDQETCLSQTSPESDVSLSTHEGMIWTEPPLSEKCEAGVGHGRIVLVSDAAVVAKDLPFFRLDHPEQAIDG